MYINSKVGSAIAVLLVFCILFSDLQATIVTIDFDDVTVPRDPFDPPLWTYSEDGFTLTPNFGEIYISNLYPPYSNAAFPSSGFGQGNDSSFTFTNDSSLPFEALSIDLLEGTGSPDHYGVTLFGTKSDLSIVTQTFRLDGIAGSQTFAISSAFTDLISLKIGEDASNGFFLDKVAVDNVVLGTPEPATVLLFGLGGLFLRKRRA
jgi:hypothetical protein